jgi:hypothetical protein
LKKDGMRLAGKKLERKRRTEITIPRAVVRKRS